MYKSFQQLVKVLTKLLIFFILCVYMYISKTRKSSYFNFNSKLLGGSCYLCRKVLRYIPFELSQVKLLRNHFLEQDCS